MQWLHAQLHRRALAAARSEPLWCGCRDPDCRDPDGCRCTRQPLTERGADTWMTACAHLLERGLTPMVSADVAAAVGSVDP